MNRTIKDATVKRYYYDARSTATASRRLRLSIQFRPQAQDPKRPHALRVHLQGLDFPARTIHIQSEPANAGTKHLVADARSSARGVPFFFSLATAVPIRKTATATIRFSRNRSRMSDWSRCSTPFSFADWETAIPRTWRAAGAVAQDAWMARVRAASAGAASGLLRQAPLP